MGFLKNIVDAVTGWSAEVSIEAEKPSRFEPFTIRIRAVADDDLTAGRVYGKIRGTETIVARGVDVVKKPPEGEEAAPQAAGGPQVAKEDVEQSAETFSAEFDLAGATALEADQEYVWETTFQLPANAQPSYQGPNAKHVWEIQGGLEVKGVDPTSDQVAIQIE